MSKIPIEQTKFYCMREDKINEILTRHKDNPLLSYVKELWNLIDYINKRNEWDRKALCAFKHKHAWREYDKDLTYYNTKTRTYEDRPVRTDENGGC